MALLGWRPSILDLPGRQGGNSFERLEDRFRLATSGNIGNNNSLSHGTSADHRLPERGALRVPIGEVDAILISLTATPHYEYILFDD